MANITKIGGPVVGTTFDALDKSGNAIGFPYGYGVPTPTEGEEPTPNPTGPHSGDISRLPADIEGRVTRIVPAAQNITQARIKTQPDPAVGRGSINPDMTVSLRLENGTAGQSCALVYEYQTAANPGVWVETTYSIASIADAFGSGHPQDGAFEAGLSPWYQQDANRRSVIAPGDNHRKFHVSMTGHTVSAIAAAHSISADQITNAWLLANSAHASLGGDGTVKYGETPATALHKDVALPLWYSVNPTDNTPHSHWLLFKRGENFGAVGHILSDGHNGESVLHPIVVGAYGTGADPVIATVLNVRGTLARAKGRIVLRDIKFENSHWNFGSYADPVTGDRLRIDVLVEDTTVVSPDHTCILGICYGVTIRRLRSFDQWKYNPAQITEGGITYPFINPQGQMSDASSLHTPGAAYMLIDECFIDWGGHSRTYSYWGHIEDGSGPSPLSHPSYSKKGMGTVVRNNVFSRNGGDGSQFRSGAYLINNVLLMNNGPLNVGLAEARDAGQPTGQFSTAFGNIIHMGGYWQAVTPKRDYIANYDPADEVLPVDGDKWAIFNNMTDGTLGIGSPYASFGHNLIAHSDPEGTRQTPETYGSWGANHTRERFTGYKTAPYNDTIVYSWVQNANQNAGLVNPSLASVATLPAYFRDHVGPVAAGDKNLDDGFNWWRSIATSGNPNDWWSEFKRFANYMKEGFGIKAIYERTTTKTMRFYANALTDGKYTWNPMNWNGWELPIAGDSINLAGCRVRFGYEHTTWANIDFGAGGGLIAETGYLRITGNLTGTDKLLGTRYCGQLRIAGYSGSDAMAVACAGGWFVNEGALEGNVDYAVSGEARAILAESGGSFTLGAGKTMTITGGLCRVGTDAVDGGAVSLTFAGTVQFVQDSTGCAKIGGFHSGLHGKVTPSADISATVTGTIDATGVTAGTVLIEADTLDATGATLTNCRVVGQTIVAGLA